MRQSTLKKLETIIVKMEDITGEIKESDIKHQLLNIKSKMLSLRNDAERATRK